MDVFTFMLWACLIGGACGLIYTRMAQGERREAQKLYERIVMEKIDALKTGLAMGLAKDDLAELDDRLERMVGAEKLTALLKDGQPPESSSSGKAEHLPDTDIEDEITRLRQQREKQ